MKRFFIILTCGVMLFSFAGCASDKKESNEPVQETAAEAGGMEDIVIDAGDITGDGVDIPLDGESGEGEAEDEVVIEQPETPEYEMEPQGKVSFDREAAAFDYSDEEIKAFEDFSDGFDKQVFAGLEPLSIAKIWIQCGTQGAWESEYEIFETSSIEAVLAKQDLYNAHRYDEDKTAGNENSTKRVDAAKTMFYGLSEAKFVEENENEGYLEFLANDDIDTARLHFVKEDGVWQIVYNSLEVIEGEDPEAETENAVTEEPAAEEAE